MLCRFIIIFVLCTSSAFSQIITDVVSFKKVEEVGFEDRGIVSFATSAANIGDLNGDSIDELVIGSENEGGHSYVSILFLNALGKVEYSQLIGNGKGGFTCEITESDGFGELVEVIGDVDGNGVNDLVVSAKSDAMGERDVFRRCLGGALKKQWGGVKSI